MELDMPIFAVQRLASGQWLVRAPSDDPFLPAVAVVDVIGDSEEPAVAIDQDAIEKVEVS
jgi:hypothetical protein